MVEISMQSSYYPGVLAGRVVNAIIGIIEFMLLARIALELFGANPSAPFIAWAYGVTWGMMGPFAGAFSNLSLGGASVIDLVAVLAMIVYAVLGWIIIRLLSFIFAW